MYRRTLLQWLAAVAAATPLSRLRLFAQVASLSDENIAALGAIAEVVLPTSLGRAGRDRVVAAFVVWVRNYREGADRGHGYGSSNLSAPTGPSPAARYPAQFAALDRAARAEGAVSFSAMPLDRRRAVIEMALETPQPVANMPARPNGANLVADFMGFYFNGQDAQDLAYRAAIGRYACRGLDGSEREPARR
jgi:hypothetical protein